MTGQRIDDLKIYMPWERVMLSLGFVPRGPITKSPVLANIMVWCRLSYRRKYAGKQQN